MLFQVKTGEEDEETVYRQRSKLFKFRDSQWKERGVGEIKMMRHKHSGRIRIVMRRQQVHKVCCNHYLTPDLVLEPMSTSERAFCWKAIDFSDPKGRLDQFAARFKVSILNTMFHLIDE